MTDTSDAPPLDPPQAPVAPASSPWRWRITVAVALLGAVAVLWYGARRADTGTPGERDPVVVLQVPAPDARAVRQTEIGAELKVGYDGRLTIDGIEIPEAEMEGAVDPRTVDPADLARYGVRPNNRNRVFFKPGEGKVIEELPTGEIEIVLRYFRDRQDERTGRVIRWTIEVS